MIGRLIRRGSVALPLVIVAVVLADCAPAASLPDTPSRAARATERVPTEGAALVPTPAQVASLRTHPGYATEPFVVTNLLAFNDVRGRQLYFGEYAPRALELIRSHGGEIVWAGEVDEVFAATAWESWDDMILVRWPSRRAFVEAFESSEYASLQSARESGLARTVMLLTGVQDSRITVAAADSAEAAADIAALSAAWLAAYERQDAAGVTDLFTEDGIYAANTGELLRGRSGIRDGVRGWFALQPQMFASLGLAEEARIALEQDLVRFRVIGDAAYTLSRFIMRAEPSGCELSAGHGLAVWRRQAGDAWRIESQTVNRDREPPENACGRR
jgi:uncharacterized protein (TIGR02246 family)